MVARVFISHAARDTRPVETVRRWLVEEGHEVFLDEDVHDGIALGDQWQERLHERLRWADAVVCLVTSAFVSSVWCGAEAAIALSRGSRVLPVRAEAGAVHPLLDTLHHVDLTDDADEARAKLAEALRQVDARGGSGWPDDRSPSPASAPSISTSTGCSSVGAPRSAG